MSKFHIEAADISAPKGALRLRQLSRPGGLLINTLDLEPGDLADLATATQAALAEQNSRVMMAPDCKCGLSGTSPICTEPFTNIGRNCCGNRLPSGMCAHADACHATQNTENQGE